MILDLVPPQDGEAPERLVERGLAAIGACADRAVLAASARAFDARGGAEPGRFASPAWRMLAGAAAAAALDPPVATDADPRVLVQSLDSLQRALDAGQPRDEALTTFARLGAIILARPVPRFLDQSVSTDGEDDSVYCWTAGAMALKNARPRPSESAL